MPLQNILVIIGSGFWFQGQALARISIGNTFDSKGDWASSLAAFKEGYRQVYLFVCIVFQFG